MVKSEKSINFKHLFDSGQYAAVKKYSQNRTYTKADWEWVFCSLCILGNQEEALIQQKDKDFTSAQLFFLIIALVRSGQIKKAKTYFEKLRLQQEIRDRFFYYQVFAFYAHYRCRYQTSLKLNLKSYRYALIINDPLLKTLALDLLAHNHVFIGSIYRGIHYFDEAQALAKILKNQSWFSAIEVSKLNYNSRFSIDPELDLKRIKKALSKVKGIDNYSEGALLLSKAHLYSLIGDLESASKTLSDAQKIIFGHKLYRHMANWYHEKAYSLFLAAQDEDALRQIELGIECLDQNNDLMTMLKMCGLKMKIFKRKKIINQELERQIKVLSQKIGGALVLNKLNRDQEGPFLESEDPLNKFFNSFFSSHWTSRLNEAVTYKYWGLLREKVVSESSFFVITGIQKGGAIILTPQSAYSVNSGFSHLLYQGLYLINEYRTVSKEQLVKTLWGFDYDPQRHDNLVFSLIRRLKELIPMLRGHLKGEGHSYHLDFRFKFVNWENSIQREVGIKNFQPPLPGRASLNIRQHKAMTEMNAGKTYQVKEYANSFRVTTMTALRDLSELTELGFIHRFGRARATTYGVLK